MNRKKVAFVVVSVVLMAFLVTSGLFGEGSQPNSIYRYLSVFTEVFSLVRTNYVDPVDTTKLVNGAFDGVTQAVDEFSYYVPPTEMSQFEDADETETTGLGLSVSKRIGFAYVIAPVAGSPADKAGIKGGDFVERIDGKLTTEMPLWEIETLLASAHGRPTKLTVVHAGATDRKDYDVTGGKFTITPPSLEILGDVARITIPYFTDATPKELGPILSEVNEAGKTMLLIDVRGSAGGSMSGAIGAADELLDTGVITAIKGRRVQERQWDATRSVDYNGKVMVLMDNTSAGPAEVFAAAISGNHRGKTVGVTTYGRAIEQRFVKLPSGGGLEITVGHYTRPDMTEITSEGVKPDMPVRLVLLDLGDEAIPGPKPKDPLLDRAIAAMHGADPNAD